MVTPVSFIAGHPTSVVDPNEAWATMQVHMAGHSAASSTVSQMKATPNNLLPAEPLDGPIVKMVEGYMKTPPVYMVL